MLPVLSSSIQCMDIAWLITFWPRPRNCSIWALHILQCSEIPQHPIKAEKCYHCYMKNEELRQKEMKWLSTKSDLNQFLRNIFWCWCGFSLLLCMYVSPAQRTSHEQKRYQVGNSASQLQGALLKTHTSIGCFCAQGGNNYGPKTSCMYNYNPSANTA